MIFIIFTFLIFGGWYVWVKIRGTDMVKVKFDYTTKKTSRISTWKIIVAVLFLMLIFILAFTSDSMQTSAGRKVNFLIVGIVVCIYIAVILFFNIQRIKIKKFKNNYQKNSKKNKKTKIDFKVVELNLKKQKAPKQERANQMKEREERK